MKKINFLILSLVAVVLMVAVVGCNKAKNDPSLTKVNSDINTLAFTSLSSASILSNESTAIEAKNIRRLATSNTTEPDMTKVNEYLQMMESMFADNGPLLVDEVESDRTEYAIKMEFTSKDLSGKETKYVLYLNQELEVEIDDDDDDLFEEQEKEYRLTGIAVIEGVEYTLIGEKESEDGEAELEIKISLDKSNYVIIEQEIERDEVELKYQIVKNGKKFSTVSFEVENAKEFEASFTTTENGYKETYRFYKDGKKTMIKYISPELVYTIIVKSYQDSETGEIIYEYKVSENDKTYKFEK